MGPLDKCSIKDTILTEACCTLIPLVTASLNLFLILSSSLIKT